MDNPLTLEQRFALQRAKVEVRRMSRPALEYATLQILRTRFAQKNQIQQALMSQGILLKLEEAESGYPELMSEKTFIELLSLADDDELPTSIDDMGWEDEDLGDDNAFLI